MGGVIQFDRVLLNRLKKVGRVLHVFNVNSDEWVLSKSGGTFVEHSFTT